MLSLDRWNLIEETSDFHRDINRAFGWSGVPVKSGLPWLPAAEVTSGSEGWTIRMGLSRNRPKGRQCRLRSQRADYQRRANDAGGQGQEAPIRAGIWAFHA